MFTRWISLVLFGLLLASPAAAAAAQDVIRVGVCNPGKVFAALDERKAIEDALRAERDKLQLEAKQKQGEIEQLKRERDALDPNSPLYQRKNQELMKAAIEFDVWAKLAEQNLAMTEKTRVKGLFDKIAAATKTIAEKLGLDLVLAEQDPQANLESLTPDQLRALLAAKTVLFKNEKADITQKVIDQMNADYAKPRP
jgi:Skp family chaperone for outer membrane proteins